LPGSQERRISEGVYRQNPKDADLGEARGFREIDEILDKGKKGSWEKRKGGRRGDNG